MTTAVEAERVTVADLVAALRMQQARTPTEHVTAVATRSHEWIPQPNALVVIGAHAGAGTTTVSVAVTDTIANCDLEQQSDGLRLIDAAPREHSGMGPAVECAIGGLDADWRAGRRRKATILRPTNSPAVPGDLPTISDTGSGTTTARGSGTGTGSGSQFGSQSRLGWLVVDAGWSYREVMASCDVQRGCPGFGR